jgi:hypothetical protein
MFGPPGSGSVSQRYGSGSGSFPFSHKVVKRTEIMLAKFSLTQNSSLKQYRRPKSEDNVPAAKL